MSCSNLTPISLTTNDNEVAHQAATRLRPNLEKEWDTECIIEVLSFLATQDLRLKTIAKYELGRIVKKIQKKASRNVNRVIVNKAKVIISKWKALIPKDHGETNGTSPNTVKSELPFVLGIQDRPSTKDNVSFNSVLLGGKCYVRQDLISFEALLDKIENKQPTLNHRCFQKPVFKPIVTSAKETMISRKNSHIKRVRFKPDHQLSTFQEHHTETPTRNTNKTISSSCCHEWQYTWYRPLLIQIPHPCKRPEITRSYRTTLNGYKPTNSLPPSSPTEQDDEIITNKHTKIIPLFEIDTSDDDEPYVQTPDIANKLPFPGSYLPSSYHQ